MIDDQPVFICENCGRGFLVAQPNGIDSFPLWATLSSEAQGPECWGRIKVVRRSVAIRAVEKMECKTS